MTDVNMTKYGAVESRQDGQAYAKWLKMNEGKYDGVILSLPNFGDENGAIAALEECGVPILIQAYPDEIGKWILNTAVMLIVENLVLRMFSTNMDCPSPY